MTPFALLDIATEIVYYFEGNGQQFYFYYDIALFMLMLFGTAISAGAMLKNTREVGRKYAIALLLVTVAFLSVEIIFIQPTNQIWNDEIIHMSIAKSILYDHLSSICSFSLQPHCVSGTGGLFQQPTGWDMILSMAYLFFGVGFSTAFNTALLLSAISIPLVFYVSFMLLGDRDVALLSSALLAFTPLFLTFSRSTVLEVPELTLLLLSLALVLTYLRNRDIKTGFASVFAIAYTLLIKDDAVLVLLIVLAFLILLARRQRGKPWPGKPLHIAALAIMLAAILTPQIIFLHITWARNTFGTGPGQSKFSLGYLASNLYPNALFWLGAYGSIVAPYRYQAYNIEYPITYALLAIAGVAFLAYRKHPREALALALWFLVVFIFYASYYGGGVLFNSGDDVRYYMAAFPAVSILAAFGAVRLHSGIYAFVLRRMRRGKKRIAKKPSLSKDRIKIAVALLVLAALLSDPLFEIATVTSKSPQSIYPFSGERFEEQTIISNSFLIPQGCFVLSYEPPLWNILNVSNIYADWFLIPQYRAQLLNLSRGCLYFEYSLDCLFNSGGYEYDNTTTGCPEILGNLTMTPVFETPYKGSGWDFNFTLYKVDGFKNGSQLYR